MEIAASEQTDSLAAARAQWRAGSLDKAIVLVRRHVATAPDDPFGWRLLADMLQASGDADGADQAHIAAIKAGINDPVLFEVARALRSEQIAEAENLLRQRLRDSPTDVTAIRMLADVAARLGRHEDASLLLLRSLELSPGYNEARQALAEALTRQGRFAEGLEQADWLVVHDAGNPDHAILKASILLRSGDQASAIAIYAGVLRDDPNRSRTWMSYGHALKAAGRAADAIEAYRRAVELAPERGEAWWSLANLKTFRFSEADIEAMRKHLARAGITEDDQLNFHFALAKAAEDAGDFAEAFEGYSRGNAIRGAQLRHHPEDVSRDVAALRRVFDDRLFAEKRGLGCAADDPIFIVGLPRSGSTLVEQILSSHSQIEGTMELPNMPAIVRALDQIQGPGTSGLYPEILADLDAGELRELGERYLAETRPYRRTDRRFFIDKLPNNWINVGLIHLLLPNARIIDVRRHPVGCCLSGFKQHFAQGHAFSYSLADIGSYYAEYVQAMAHFDSVLPGRVHRVIYERLVTSTEVEIRGLLAHIAVPFEDNCLKFWNNDRVIRTPSSEQVRRPIFRDALDHWHHFEPWLAPLKEALGDIVDFYPDAPPLKTLAQDAFR